MIPNSSLLGNDLGYGPQNKRRSFEEIPLSGALLSSLLTCRSIAAANRCTFRRLFCMVELGSYFINCHQNDELPDDAVIRRSQRLLANSGPSLPPSAGGSGRFRKSLPMERGRLSLPRNFVEDGRFWGRP